MACVCVFAKPPRPGQVKTRLAPALGPAGSARLARAFFADTWRMVSGLRWAVPILATTDVDAAEWQRLPLSTRIWSQGKGSLGSRMERVLRQALDAQPIAIGIGTDSPGLPSALLVAARDALRSYDAVLGPSDDGGFYLIGLRCCPEGLFDGITWSSSETRTQTIRRLRQLGLTVTTLPPWFDVDRPSDVDRLRVLASTGQLAAPETTRVLADLFPEPRRRPVARRVTRMPGAPA